MLKSCLSFSYKTTTRRTSQSQYFRTILEATASSRKTSYKSRNYTRSRKILTDNSSSSSPPSSFATMPKRKKGPHFYAVAVGRNTGIFSTWDECNSQVKGFKGGKFKKFSAVEEAQTFISAFSNVSAGQSATTTTVAKEANTETSPVAVSVKKKRPRVVASKTQKAPESGDDATNPIHIEISPAVVVAATKPRAVSSTTSRDADNAKRQPHKVVFHVMFDGGARGNPHGDAGSGTYILAQKFYSCNDTAKKKKNTTTQKAAKNEIVRSTAHIRTYLGLGLLTNNQAEYTGLVKGLRHISKALHKNADKKQQLREVTIFVQGDSDLIIKQMNGIYACKSPKLKSYFGESKDLVAGIQKRCKSLGTTCQIIFEHVYRKDNKIADGLANEAMDAKRSWTISKGDDDDNDNDDNDNDDDGIDEEEAGALEV